MHSSLIINSSSLVKSTNAESVKVTVYLNTELSIIGCEPNDSTEISFKLLVPVCIFKNLVPYEAGFVGLTAL